MMNNTAGTNGTQRTLATVLAVLALAACVAGLWPVERNAEPRYFSSLRGERVELEGAGLYRNDSKSFAAQGKAQDLVTLVIGIPLLIFSLVAATKGGARWALVLAGTFGYFTYTYATYSFGCQYNEFFLVYVAAFSTSLFGLIITLLKIDAESVKAKFRSPPARRAAIIFDFFVGAAITVMWLGRILGGPDMIFIEHYTTLPIQVMDLAIVVPLAVLSGILLTRNEAAGYLLTGLFLMKGLTLALAVGAMIIWSALEGLPVNTAEAAVFVAIILGGFAVAVSYISAIRD